MIVGKRATTGSFYEFGARPWSFESEPTLVTVTSAVVGVIKLAVVVCSCAVRVLPLTPATTKKPEKTPPSIDAVYRIR